MAGHISRLHCARASLLPKIKPAFQSTSVFLRLPPSCRGFHASPKHRIISTLLISTHETLSGLHNITGLPWALTLPLGALLIRLSITLPLAVYTRRADQRRGDVLPLLYAWKHQFQRSNMAKSGHKGPTIVSRDVQRDVRIKRREVYRRWGCSIWKSYLPIIQLPIWLLVVETVRGMCGIRKGILGMMLPSSSTPDAVNSAAADLAIGGISEVMIGAELANQSALDIVAVVAVEPSLATEGIFWFPDLTMPDPMLILPFMLSASMLLNIYSKPHRDRDDSAEISLYQKRLTRALGFVALVAGPLTLQMPTAMLLYWVSSSLMAYGQSVLLDKYMPLRRPVKPCKPSMRSSPPS